MKYVVRKRQVEKWDILKVTYCKLLSFCQEEKLNILMKTFLKVWDVYVFLILLLNLNDCSKCVPSRFKAEEYIGKCKLQTQNMWLRVGKSCIQWYPYYNILDGKPWIVEFNRLLFYFFVGYYSVALMHHEFKFFTYLSITCTGLCSYKMV